ncbi:bacillithiol biosynthesis BshC [Salibacterium salarium]|uniref:Bacillithiol biosynthesis BshC n=1 Tax=Salibacterium salarium TaxID=284579 RepID=A0A3R9QIC5_9BACI|nr:bacillithiol biosynthesis BshC [Salibacterium salarium]
MGRVQRIKKAEQMLVPFKNPQERVYNMIFFLNEYGSTFVQDLKSLEIERNGKHKYIKM